MEGSNESRSWECDLATAHVRGNEFGPAGTGPSSKSRIQALRRLRKQGEMTMKFAKAALLFTVAAVAASAQVNIGEQKPEASLPFTMTTVANFELPWRLAFLPDGRMLITEKVGPVWLVSQQGKKIPVGNTPAVYWQGQNGMHGVFVSPHYATDQSIYFTYAEPGDYGGGLALARARLGITATSARLENLQVL